MKNQENVKSNKLKFKQERQIQDDASIEITRKIY